MKIKVIVILIFAVLGAVSCIENAPSKNGIVIAESKSYEASLFRQNCAVCHGAEANGKEMDGRLIPSLRYGHAATISREEVYYQIKKGKLPMPAFEKQLSEADIQKMVKFVMRDLQARDVAD